MATAKEGPLLVEFPCDLQTWPKVKAALLELRGSVHIDDIVKSLDIIVASLINGTPSLAKENMILRKCVFYGLKRFLEQDAEAEEKHRFYSETFPFIIDCALKIEELRPEAGLHYSLQKEECSIELKRDFVASILACAFLCLFPRRPKDIASRLNDINFNNFFHYLPSPPQSAKLRCILHYFDRVSCLGDSLDKTVKFSRQVLSSKEALHVGKILSCDRPLCPVTVHKEGKIEDAGSEILQIDFANSYIGGGVLHAGRVQEEIRFCISPELIAAMLFMQCMLDNEAIVIEGFEQFSHYAGYADNLKYFGNFKDKSLRDSNGNIITKLSAIDAIPFMWVGQQKQYDGKNLMREINKAYIGFLQPSARVRKGRKKLGKSEDSLASDSSEEYYSAPESLEDEGLDPGQVRPSAFLPPSLSGEQVLTYTDQDITSTFNVVDPSAEKSCADIDEEGGPSCSSDNYGAVTSGADTYDEKRRSPDEEEGDSSSSSSFNLDLFELENLRTEVLRRRGSGVSDVSFHSSRRSSSGTRHSSDYSDFDTWAANFRRRSSNLSDLSSASRRSSSRYSSDFSSEFEEYYESFQNLERRKIQHTAIQEETGNPVIADFANTLVSSLLQESSKVAAQLDSGVREFEVRHPGFCTITKPKPVKPKVLGQAPYLPPLTDTRKYHGRDDSDSSSDSSPGEGTSVVNFADNLVQNVFSQTAVGATSDAFHTHSPAHSAALSGSESDISDSYKLGKKRRISPKPSEPNVDAIRCYVDRMFGGAMGGAGDASGTPSVEKYTYHFHCEGADGHSPEVSQLEAPPGGSYLNLDYSHSSQDGASSSDVSIDNINISLSQPLSGASMDSSSQSESCYPCHSYADDTSSVGNFVDSFVNSVISSALQVTEQDHDQSDASSFSHRHGEGAHNIQNATSVADRMVNQVFSDLRDEFEQSIPDSMKLLQSGSGSGSSGPYSYYSHYPRIVVSHYPYPCLMSFVDCLITSAFDDAMLEIPNILPKCQFPASPEVVTYVDSLLSDSLFGAYHDLQCRNFPVAMEANSRKQSSNFLSVKPSSSSSSSLWSRSSFSSASSGDRSPGSGDRSPVAERPTLPGPSSHFATRRQLKSKRVKSQSFSDYSTGNIMDDIKSASISHRRHCSLTGFFDPTLSRFAEELMQMDTSTPPIDIFSTSDSSMSSPRQHSSSSDASFSQSPLVSSSSSSSSNRPTPDYKSRFTRKKSSEKLGAVGGSVLRKQGMKPKSKKKSQSWHPSILQNKKKEKSLKKKTKSKLVLELESYAENMMEKIFDDAYYTIQYLWYEFWPYLPTDSDMSSSEKSFPLEEKKGVINTLIITYAEQVAEKIMKDVFADHRVKRQRRKQVIWHWSEMSDYCDVMEMPYLDLEDFASTFVTCVIHESLQIVHGWKSEDSPALGGVLALFSRDQQREDYYTKGDVWQAIRPVATGNWGCGAFGGDPQLKAMIQWIAATQAGCPAMIYYTFRNQRVNQLSEMCSMILERGWTVGLLMKHIEDYCKRAIMEMEENGSLTTALFEYLQQQM
ncbi:uncharacterized protein LOC135495054 [Lineus longissimus]|uniref:uncharacterized protein LOC135495054 n=1 Tax=Lineus longissimus TaxID=88925 RepID=UPI002B4F421D